MFFERGLGTADHVDVACFAMLGIQMADRTGDHITPVASLSDVLIISQFEHELMTSLRVLCCSKTPGFNALAESIVGKRWGNNMESGSYMIVKIVPHEVTISSYSEMVDLNSVARHIPDDCANKGRMCCTSMKDPGHFLNISISQIQQK